MSNNITQDIIAKLWNLCNILLLIYLGSSGSMLVRQIFANAGSFIKKPATLWRKPSLL
jgi:hypothetical protein